MWKPSKLIRYIYRKRDVTKITVVYFANLEANEKMEIGTKKFTQYRNDRLSNIYDTVFLLSS